MKLDLSNIRLMSLDGFDLTGVTELDCSKNLLTSLPSLPPALERLDCENNRLTSLPSLPPALERLDCDNNRLTSLPPLPPSLKVLHCSDNQLTSLPPLPSSLEVLQCSINQLTSLPPLPDSLRLLYCNNPLTSLPDLPWGLHWMWDEEKMDQHNKKRADLEMDKVDRLPDKAIWDEINRAHIIWQYRLGGEKWAEACKKIF